MDIINSSIEFVLARQSELLQHLGEHIVMTYVATFFAAIIGIMLALIAFYFPRMKAPIIGFVNITLTVPSLALLVLLYALFETLGMLPAMVALVLYGLLPVTRNTLTGLENTAPALIEAARGIGLTPWQQLWLVRIPLALPHMASGVRVSANFCVAIATIAAFIGAGGLGQLINRGLYKSDVSLILLGAIPTVLLALLIDYMLASIQRRFLWAGEGVKAPKKKHAATEYMLRIISILMPLGLFLFGVYHAYVPTNSRSDENTITVATKTFTESVLLGEIIAQQIERHTDIVVNRRFELGGTLLVHQAIMGGDIDIYPEYTGTSTSSIIKQDAGRDPQKVYQFVKDYYKQHYNLRALSPLGFNNSYVFTVHEKVMQQYKLTTLSDLIRVASDMHIGVDFEFAERDDGLKGLKKAYNVRFKQVRDLHPSIIYEVINRGEVDAISGYTTDGRIKKYGLFSLEDDLGFFPPYDAYLVMRDETVEKFPQAYAALQQLSGSLDDEYMRNLNYRVDALGESIPKVASDFLDKLHSAQK